MLPAQTLWQRARMTRRCFHQWSSEMEDSTKYCSIHFMNTRGSNIPGGPGAPHGFQIPATKSSSNFCELKRNGLVLVSFAPQSVGYGCLWVMLVDSLTMIAGVRPCFFFSFGAFLDQLNSANGPNGTRW
jgi:hypothetical protein